MTNLESPKWFQDALEQKPESQSIEVDGANTVSYTHLRAHETS